DVARGCKLDLVDADGDAKDSLFHLAYGPRRIHLQGLGQALTLVSQRGLFLNSVMEAITLREFPAQNRRPVRHGHAETKKKHAWKPPDSEFCTCHGSCSLAFEALVSTQIVASGAASDRGWRRNAEKSHSPVRPTLNDGAIVSSTTSASLRSAARQDDSG